MSSTGFMLSLNFVNLAKHFQHNSLEDATATRILGTAWWWGARCFIDLRRMAPWGSAILEGSSRWDAARYYWVTNFSKNIYPHPWFFPDTFSPCRKVIFFNELSRDKLPKCIKRFNFKIQSIIILTSLEFR